ncbi:MAG: sigma-54 dependent transcriptional regulator [Bacteroidales bacterium]|jgi:DNA-binding NtrC family response regulator|nr:sigma-54 dependent transcriptional regulator [Bacteroidales bacterium]
MNTSGKGKILIIDDNEDVLFALNLLLKPHVENIRVSADPAKIARFIEQYRPDVILLDMNFRRDAISGQEGFAWLQKILEIDPQAVVILMTAYADTGKAVQAVKAGATDFISKPWEKEKLLTTISSALQLRASRNEVSILKKQMTALYDEPAGEIIGESEAMQHVFSMIAKLAGTDANILILGENGTGKDIVARAIYQHSPRAGEVFVSIDLGSIPESLFESELFGYEKGAFTDARKEKPGRMEAASGGTLFLDEIANLSLPMQAKLLTAIEKRQIMRLGSNHHIPVDVRFICATNSDVYRDVEDGRFRQDLLYRINTIELHIPPLRERGNDTILLADHFVHRFAMKYKKNVQGIAKEAQNKLLAYHWPGNVRELQHAVERALILSDGNVLRSADFILQPAQNRNWKTSESLNLETLEAQAIERALHRTGGNVNKAAELLGITRFALYRKLKR